MLPLAPALPLGPDHKPLFGAYRGPIDRVEWSALAGPVTRTLRQKTWFYVSVADQRSILAAAVIDVGWSMSAFAYFFDRTTRTLRADLNSVVPPLLFGKVSRSPQGNACFSMPGVLAVSMARTAGKLELAVESRKLEVNVLLDVDRAPAPLVAISPIQGGVANCTQKTSAVPVVAGYAEVEGRRVELSGAWGAIDFTCGLLARETSWRWASAAGVDRSGAPVGLNLVTGFNQHEDVLWSGGRLIPVAAPRLEFDDPLGAWRITSADGRVDLKFEPEGHRRQNTDLLLAKSIYTQPVGAFSGVVRGADGQEVRLERVPGVTEVHLAKW